jgi:hypothetical protein
VASETDFDFELGLEWIKNEEETVASAGWSTLSNYAMVNEDADLDLDAYSQLLDSVPTAILDVPNRVKYTMNGFVIAVGSVIVDLTEKAKAIASEVGKVKVEDKGRLGKKKKTARC